MCSVVPLQPLDHASRLQSCCLTLGLVQLSALHRHRCPYDRFRLRVPCVKHVKDPVLKRQAHGTMHRSILCDLHACFTIQANSMSGDSQITNHRYGDFQADEMNITTISLTYRGKCYQTAAADTNILTKSTMTTGLPWHWHSLAQLELYSKLIIRQRGYLSTSTKHNTTDHDRVLTTQVTTDEDPYTKVFHMTRKHRDSASRQTNTNANTAVTSL